MTGKIGAFPDNESLMRVVVSITIKVNDEWLVRQYINRLIYQV